MPNVTFPGVNAAKAKKAKKEQIGYTGKRPPKGLYKVNVKRLGIKLNKNKELMLNCVCEIAEPEGSPKAKYNGYGFWWNGNVTDEGSGYINQFLLSITGGKQAVVDAFWDGKMKVSEKPAAGKVAFVLAIGPWKPQAATPAIVNTRLGKPYQGEVNLAVSDWLLPSQASKVLESEEHEDEAEAAEDDVDVDLEGDEDSDESADSDDEESDEDDDADAEYVEDEDNDDGEPPF